MLWYYPQENGIGKNMKYIIKESQAEVFEKTIQNIINSEVNSIKNDTEDMGLGEMDELDEIESVEKIVIKKINKTKRLRVFVILFSNTEREDFFNFMAELNHRVSMWFPNIFIQLDKIKYINA